MSSLWSKLTSLQTLTASAFVAGFVTVGGGLYFQHKIQANFKNQEFFQKSVELLADYPPAQRILGASIKPKNIDMGDWTKNFTDGLKAQFTVPIRGSRGAGILYSWASRKQLGERWNIDRLDLEVNDQRWTFYKTPNSPEDNATDTPNADSVPKQTNLGPLRYVNK